MPGLTTIVFNISTGIQTIILTTILPDISGIVTVDATTQTGFSGTPLIVLNGGGSILDGLRLIAGSDGSTVKGLVIQNFTGDGIEINTSNSNIITGNYIGVTQTGTAAAANGIGINIVSSSSNTVGGTTASTRNIISGNTSYGVYITGASATSNIVQGNYIGTDFSGTAAVANGNSGIMVNASAMSNTIGGTVSGAGNLISGNTNNGLYIDASNTVIQGNYIGTNASGTGAIANGAPSSATGGVYINSGSGIMIGGTTALARNLLSGNGGAGIWVQASTSATIQGNYIGVDSTGDVALGNTRWGIVLQASAAGIQIGGTAAGAGNVVSGNSASSGGFTLDLRMRSLKEIGLVSERLTRQHSAQPRPTGFGHFLRIFASAVVPLARAISLLETEQVVVLWLVLVKETRFYKIRFTPTAAWESILLVMV
jgi:hypothetical protein